MNNWISKRHCQTGRGINPNPHNNGARKGPLRKVEYVVYFGDGGIFGRDRVHLECGHEVLGTKGAARCRCHYCKENLAK